MNSFKQLYKTSKTTDDQNLLAQIISKISSVENAGNSISRGDVWTIAANITGKPKQLSDNLFAAVYDLSKKFPLFLPRAGFLQTKIPCPQRQGIFVNRYT